MTTYPVLMHTALDATDVRGLAEFYRELLGLRYRPGDEPPADGSADDEDWLVLVDADGHRVLAFQEVATLARPTWPSDDVPKQMHLDFRVPTLADLRRHRRRAEALGAAAAPRPHGRARGTALRARRPRRPPVLPPRRLDVGIRSDALQCAATTRSFPLRVGFSVATYIRRWLQPAAVARHCAGRW